MSCHSIWGANGTAGVGWDLQPLAQGALFLHPPQADTSLPSLLLKTANEGDVTPAKRQHSEK